VFTGIIEEVGRVIELLPHQTGARLTVSAAGVLEDATIGASIAVNGACLTAVEITSGTFSAELAPETLRLTNLGALRPGSLVNLERPLRATGRLDGHFVLGHVDGVAQIESLETLGNENWWLRISIPGELSRYVVSKGSLAVEGISLTVAEVGGTTIGFTIIPHTYAHTSLSSYQPGWLVNVEADILAKHIANLVGERTPTASALR
jgi:riboflavin synthase